MEALSETQKVVLSDLRAFGVVYQRKASISFDMDRKPIHSTMYTYFYRKDLVDIIPLHLRPT
jgi:hypothetical protein